MSRLRGLGPLLVVVCLLALAGCTGVSGTGEKGYITAEGVPVEIEPAEREAPIDLTGEDLDGARLDLADLRGKPVVVNVWWSGCPPCRVEQPELNEAAAELGEQAEFVGINIRDASADQALAYVRRFEVPYPSFYSADGKALLAFSGALSPRSIPSTLVLDAEGRVAASVIGRVPSVQTVVDLVEQVVDE